jgi:hypothetical protein
MVHMVHSARNLEIILLEEILERLRIALGSSLILGNSKNVFDFRNQRAD